MDSVKNLNRRKILLGTGALLAAGGLGWLKPRDFAEGGHNAYFQSLSNALNTAALGRPALVIDKALLLDNIKVLTQHLQNRFDYRIVAKSLPSIPLLKTVMEASGSKKLMVFHQPFLNAIADQLPESDVLMGKPMPVNAAATFYGELKESEFNPDQQLQWLVDNPKRLQQYADLSRRLNRPMNINIELDVGLHRGGVNRDADLITMLDTIQREPQLVLSGFMGYEPHIGKVPGDPLAQRDEAMSVYSHYLQLAETHLGQSLKHLTLNGAGSPTYQYYNDGDVAQWPMNELSAGSCLAKPIDFDLATLQDHVPSAYIATPVIKALDQTQIPGVSALGPIMSAWNPNLQKSFFTYGGYWKAQPESPKGLTLNPVYGRSSNQEMLNGSSNVVLQQDDFVFLRPTQSESVFLQFGDIWVYENGAITERWPIISA
jgi:D-serine deaminase-like pyridoxal phosphate-dependent protein